MRKHLIYFFLATLFIWLSSADAVAQTTKITLQGTVADIKGNPVIGATISIRSNNTIKGGVASDVNGRFSITTNSENDIIEFSFIGYIKESHVIGKQRTFDVKLKEDSKSIDEVVVTGYQTISKERATGAFAKVSSEKLEYKRLNSLSTLLDGQIAGYTNGLIRGTSTMNGVTNPLYVIDGFPVENTRYNSTGQLVENLPDINMDDIESITVLKDAAATSIYGARAANGVVVIVTKKAVKGKTSVSFSSSITYSPYKLYTDRLTNSGDIIDIEKEWAQNNPKLQATGSAAYATSVLQNVVYTSQGMTSILKYYAGEINQQEMDTRLNTLAGKGYSYYDDVAKYAKQDQLYQQYNLSISKGSDRNSFVSSVTYKKDRFADKFSDNRTIGINIQNSSNLTSWLTFDVGTYLNITKGSTQIFNALSPGFSYMPYDVLKNSDGSNFTSTAAMRYSQDVLNNILNKYNMYSMDITPLNEIGKNIGDTRNFDARVFAKVNINLTSWLKYNAMYQYERGNDRYNILYDKSSYYVRSFVNSHASYDPVNGFKYNIPYGCINYDENQYTSGYSFRQQLDFRKTINEHHDITGLAGSEIREAKLEYANQTLYGYDPELLTFSMIDAYKLSSTQNLLAGRFDNSNLASKREMINRFVSFYGNAAYTYDGRLMATGSIRWDRSNLWGTSSKFQNKPIWSIGAAWNVSKESFLKIKWVDMLKLRISYGIGGNIAKNSAPYMTAYYSSNYNVGGIQGTISSRPNPMLSWEKTVTTNVGADFSLFKGRVNGTLEYYDKQGKDLLANTMGVPTEGVGYSTYTINNGEMYNRGVELTLNGDVIKKNEFSWNATLIYGYNKNKVTYVNVKAPVYYLQLDYPSAYPIIGNSYNGIYGFKWAGLNESGLPQVYNEKGEKTTSTPTTLDAIKYLGTTVPVHSGSFASYFKYKNYEFSFQLVYQGGHKMRNTDLPYLTSAYSSAMGGYITSLSAVNKRIVERWRKAGDEAKTDIPAIVFAENIKYNSQSYDVYRYADINVIDASNVRLSNISLSYRLPSTICSKMLMKSARIQLNVENLYMYTFDKEAKYSLGGYNSPNYVFSLNLNF